MAQYDNNYIPIITTSSNDYLHPSLNKDGQWVVSASAVNAKPNEVLLYNPTSRLVTTPTPYTVSQDYYGKVKEYERRLQEQMRGWVDPEDHTQINSIADILTYGGSKPKGLPFSQERRDYYTEVFGEIKKYYRDFVVYPFLSDDPLVTKASKALVQGLTNMNETLDLVTGANLVKGFVQEGTEGLKKSINWDGTGRVQYDWNTKATGNPVIDGVTNIALEVISDPTNWVSFGSAAAIKSVGKNALPDLLVKSADDVGLAFSKSQVDDITNMALRTYIYKNVTNDEFAQALGKVVTQAQVKGAPGMAVNTTQLLNFADALRANAKTGKIAGQIRTMSMLHSLRTGLDQSQKIAGTVVSYSSTYGLGYQAIKHTLRAGKQVIPFFNATMNKMFKDTELEKTTLKNYAEKAQQVEFHIKSFQDVTQSAKDYAVETTKIYTRNYQAEQYAVAKDILSRKGKTSNELLMDFNKWAQDTHGFTDGRELLEHLQKNDISAVPEELRNQVADIANDYHKLYHRAMYDSVVPAMAVLDVDFLHKADATIIKEVRTSISTMQQMGIVNHLIPPELYRDVDAALNIIDKQNTIRYAQRFVDTVDNYKLTLFARPNIFDFETLIDGKFTKIDASLVYTHLKNKPNDIIIPVIGRKRIEGILMEVGKLNTIVSILGVRHNFEKELYAIQSVLNKAKIAQTLSSITVKEALTVNEALLIIQNKIKMYKHNATKLVDTDAEMVAEQIINTTREHIEQFIDEYEHTYMAKPVANIYSDMIIDKSVANVMGETVHDVITSATHQMSNSKEVLDEIRVNLNNLDPSVPITGEAVDNAYNTLIETAEFVQDMNVQDYFIKESGLDEAIADWVRDGFSINSGNYLIAKLDTAIRHIERPDGVLTPGTPKAVTDSTALKLQVLRDQVEDLVTHAGQSVEQRVKLTYKQLSSKIYRNKLTQAYSLITLLDQADVRNTLSQILHRTGVGKFIELLNDYDTDTDKASAQAAAVLTSLAKSTVLADNAIKLIKDSHLSDEFKQAMLDTFAGEARYKNAEIYSPEYTASRWAYKSKEFIDGNRNAHLARLHELTTTANTVEAVEKLYDNLFAPKPVNTSDTMKNELERYWRMATDELAKSYSNTYNIVYSANQTGLQNGTIYEDTFMLPSGEKIRLVNVEARDTFMRTVDQYTARKLHGKSKEAVVQDILDNAAKLDNQPYTRLCANELEFAEAHYELFRRFKQEARELSRRNHVVAPRLIGFNNAVDSLGTDRILAKFLDANKTNVHMVYNDVDYKSLTTVRSFDVAQWLRIQHEGAVPITDNILNEVTAIATKLQKLQAQMNAGSPLVPAAIMPDFNNDVLDAFTKLSAMVTNVLDFKASKGRGVLTELTREQYALITQAFGLEELVEFQSVLRDTLKSLGQSMSTIKNTNTALGQWALIQSAISKRLGVHNIMQLLPKSNTGMSPYGYRKAFDPSLFNEWFDMRYIQEFQGIEDASTMFNLNKIAETLQSRKERIAHQLLLTELPNNTFVKLIDMLMGELKALPNYRYSEWAKEVQMLRLDNAQVNNFLIAEMVWNAIQKVADTNTLNRIFDRAMQLPYTGAEQIMSYIKFPEESVRYNDPLHVPNLPKLHSELLEESNYLMQLTKDLRKVLHNPQRETLYQLMDTTLQIKEETGWSLPSLFVQQRFVENFANLVDHVKFLFDDAQKWYDNQKPKTAADTLNRRRTYTKRVQEIIKMLDDISGAHAVARNTQALTMTAEDYAMYLFSHNQGFQIIDLASGAVQSLPNELTTFMHTLKEAEQYGVRYVEDTKRHFIFTYLDTDALVLPEKFMAGVTEEALAKIAQAGGGEVTDAMRQLHMYTIAKDTFRLPAANITMPEELIELPLASHYNKFIDTMDEYFEGAYSNSMHRTVNVARYNEAKSILPKAVQDKLISYTYLDAYNLAEGQFMHNVIGDYGSGVGNIFTTHSPNLMTNLAAGFNVALNRIRGKDLYASQLFNKDNTLSAWVGRVTQVVTHAEMMHAVQKLPYVVANLEGGRIVPVDVRTPKKYEAALKSNAVLLDYQTYTRAVEVLNDNRIHNKFIKTINKHYLGPLKLGMLMNPWTLLRNFIDSPLKGWLQSGGDPRYFTNMVRTARLLDQYEETLSKIFYTMHGATSDKAVAEFYKRYANNVPLDEGLFRKMLTFDTNSAANPTTVQLALNNNLVERLYRYVGDIPKMRREDVKYAISIFKKHKTFDAAKNVLKKSYSGEMLDALMLLRKRVPLTEMKDSWAAAAIKKFPVTRKLMDINESYERFIRFHTFLDTAEYSLGGSISQGIKAVDLSQFNRTRDPKFMRYMETLMPFSSFQYDNYLFWTDTYKYGLNNLIALTEDIISGAWNEEELDTEEISRNMSLQYLMMSGNLILDEETGLNMKLNSSAHGTYQLLSAPVETLSESLNVPLDLLRKIIEAVNADEEAYDEDPYENPKPISRWEQSEWTNEMVQLIPFIGAEWIRWTSAFNKVKGLQIEDAVLPMLMPGMFGITTLDSSRPIGYDWYNQDEEYRKTHRFVYGVSYVPSWMTKDPRTYVDTYTRLQNFGYSKETAQRMMQEGWYMKAPEYRLRKYQPKGTGQQMPTTYFKRAYPKKTYAKRPRKVYFKMNKPIQYNTERLKYDRYGEPRRVYRTRLYNELYTKTGVARADLIGWRGANRSSRQLLLDRDVSRQIRMQRIMRQIRG